MNPYAAGVIGIAVLFLLLAIRIPIGFAMALVGFVGYGLLINFNAALAILGQAPYSEISSYTLAVIPLFVLMGQLTFYSGLSKDLYFAAYNWLGNWRGGLAMSTIVACAAFAAACGSTVATASTMGTVALPEMKRYKYDDSLATGSVAVGGTLGILIPPSTGFIIYAVVTSESIGKLFIAGILPGILFSLLLIITIYCLCRFNPNLGPAAPKVSFTNKLLSLKLAWPVIVLFILVIGGIYAGIFTANEAGGIGAFCAFLFFLIRNKNRKQDFFHAIFETGYTTAMVFMIVLGAVIFGKFLAVSNFTYELAAYIGELNVSRYLILIAILVMYLILGCVMDSIAMMLITLPIIFPLIISLGFDPIWFGVIMVLVCEMGLITPPIGVNVFVVKGVAKDVPLESIFKGIFPFIMTLAVCVILLIIFPKIALILPTFMR